MTAKGEHTLTVHCPNGHVYDVEPIVVHESIGYVGYGSIRDFCVICDEMTDGGDAPFWERMASLFEGEEE